MKFEIRLEEQKSNHRQMIAMHLIVGFVLMISGLMIILIRFLLSKLPSEHAAIAEQFPVPEFGGYLLLLVSLLLLGVLLFRQDWLHAKSTHTGVRIVEFFLLGACSYYAFSIGLTVPALIFLLTAVTVLFAIYWESSRDDGQYVIVEDRGIALPLSNRQRILHWAEIEQVIFRSGVLTINCCDNRMFQWNVREVYFDRDSFVRFCQEQIVMSMEKRKEFSW